jgi:3-hydroxyacyl-[acyl-carrier-protein] dehydratase
MNKMRTAIHAAALAPVQITASMAGQQSFCFDAEFLGFSGHFPDYPILPAVLQVLLAQLVAETVIGSSLSVVALSRAKFMQQVRPGDQIDVRVSCREKNGELRCAGELSVAEQQVASFTLVLKQEIEL